MTTTISVIGAGAGSFPGPSRVHPRLLEEAAKRLREQEGGLLVDSFVSRCGDGLELVMTHARRPGDDEVRRLASDVLRACAEIGGRMKLHGANPDHLADAVAGAAELEFEERASEPVLAFMAAGAQAGVWNVHLYRTFADPFTTPGLVRDPAMRDGFVFEVHDLALGRRALFRTPEESYDLLACIGEQARYVVARVSSKGGAIAASSAMPPPDSARGRTFGTPHPVMVVRAESGFPAVGECLSPFATPSLVAGGQRGASYAPLVPVAVCDGASIVGDGPPRATCLGFHICSGRLIGPADLFDDPCFDAPRGKCLELAEMLRDHGPFAPHQRPPSQTGSALRPATGPRQRERWEPLS